MHELIDTVAGGEGAHVPLKDADASARKRRLRLGAIAAYGVVVICFFANISLTMQPYMIPAHLAKGVALLYFCAIVLTLFVFAAATVIMANDDYSVVSDTEFLALHEELEQFPSLKAQLAGWLREGYTLRHRDVKYLHNSIRNERLARSLEERRRVQLELIKGSEI